MNFSKYLDTIYTKLLLHSSTVRVIKLKHRIYDYSNIYMSMIKYYMK